MRRRLLLFVLCLFAGTCCVSVPGTRIGTKTIPQFTLSTPAKTATPALPASLVDKSGKHSVARMRFDSDVTEESANQAIAFIEAAKAQGAEAILIEWNTNGGSVNDGFRLSKAMEESTVPVICVVDGASQSEGFYLLQSCDQRYMTKRSFLMVHEASFIIPANTQVNRAALDKLSKDLGVIVQTWTEWAGHRLKISIKQLREKIRHEDWSMDANESLKIGAVDGLVSSVSSVAKDLAAGRPVDTLK